MISKHDRGPRSPSNADALRARDLTLEAARDAGPRRSTRPLPPQQIKKLLDSRNERDVLDGLRRVIAMQYAQPPQPTLTFFPAVLKTLSNPYPSTRPLVYNYLLHHAEADPDTALLSINTIQKSLSDSNPRVRAMALKTMSGIRVPVISQIVSLAIKKGLSDLSPLVRRAAALSCIKCVRLDPSTQPQVEEYIAALLGDKQYYVAGAAVQALLEVCPDRLDMIHPVYRRLCKMVVDMDEWGQLAVLRLMPMYARKCFPERTRRVKRTSTTQNDKTKEFYEDLEPQSDDDDVYDEIDDPDPDLLLFLDSIRPLLRSRNSAVITAVTRSYFYLAPATHLSDAIDPLVALLRSPSDIQEITLQNLVHVCSQHPHLFTPYHRHFILRSTDSPQAQTLRLELLTLTFMYHHQSIQDLILAELQHHSNTASDSALTRAAVRAIGRCAQASSPTTSRRCLTLLLQQIHSADQVLVAEATTVIRHLIQRDPLAHRKTVIRLAKNLDALVSPSARASVVWLIGEFESEGDDSIGADVLRILLKGYVDEAEEVKAQIVLLATKAYLHHLNTQNAMRKGTGVVNGHSEESDAHEGDNCDPNPPSTIERLYTHTLHLARYTPSYSLRSRARLYRALLAVPTSTELASLLLLAPKPVPQHSSSGEGVKSDIELGSAGVVVGEAIGGCLKLPVRVRKGEEPDPTLRDDVGGEGGGTKGARAGSNMVNVSAGQRLDDALTAEGKGGGKVAGMATKGKSLDDWLDSESASDEEEEVSESESEEEEETDEDDESEYETDSESDRDERTGLVK